MFTIRASSGGDMSMVNGEFEITKNAAIKKGLRELNRMATEFEKQMA